MKIAITGASGFIGKLLVDKLLSQGNEVNVLTRKRNKFIDNRVSIFEGDLNDIQVLQEFVFGVDVIYHCAAEIKNEMLMKTVNENGTANLIEVSKSTISHWIQLSSTGVYGPIYSGTVNENQVYNPINEYEKTKLKSDFLVLEAAEKNNFTCTIIRPSNVFGFQMSNTSLFQLVKTIDKGFYFFVGPKGASANYVPVENVIEALYLAATNPKAKSEIYNISNWCTIEDFVNNIAKVLGKASPKLRMSIGFTKLVAKLTSFIPKNPLTEARVDALSNRAIYETTKIENKLGYKPVVTVEETIVGLVQFYKKNN